MTLILFWVLLFSSPFAIAYADVSTEQKVIDVTVWKTFRNAFEQLDGDALNSVYADSVLRVTPEGLDTENQFKVFNKTRFDENIANDDRVALDFWFDSRRTSSTTSYDVGFYRVMINSKSGSSTFYGQFHIVLRKIDGDWKIVQDWDTDSIGGRKLTAEDFDGRPLFAVP